MSKYTTTVKSICESFAKANGYTGTDVNEIIQNAYQSIFSFYFPIFEPTHRAELCKKNSKALLFSRDRSRDIWILESAARHALE